MIVVSLVFSLSVLALSFSSAVLLVWLVADSDDVVVLVLGALASVFVCLAITFVHVCCVCVCC